MNSKGGVMTQEERYERAKKRVKALRRFYSSLAVYVVVMIGVGEWSRRELEVVRRALGRRQ